MRLSPSVPAPLLVLQGWSTGGWVGPQECNSSPPAPEGLDLPLVIGHLQPAEPAMGLGCQHWEGPPVPTRPGLCLGPHPEFDGRASSWPCLLLSWNVPPSRSGRLSRALSRESLLCDTRSRGQSYNMGHPLSLGRTVQEIS